jgi:hypothetical protein
MNERKIKTLKSLGMLLINVDTSFLILGIAFIVLRGLRTLRFLKLLRLILLFVFGISEIIKSITL